MVQETDGGEGRYPAVTGTYRVYDVQPMNMERKANQKHVILQGSGAAGWLRHCCPLRRAPAGSNSNSGDYYLLSSLVLRWSGQYRSTMWVCCVCFLFFASPDGVSAELTTDEAKQCFFCIHSKRGTKRKIQMKI